MNIVLLSGGSGTRLWPLSNSVRSKQFLKVLRNEAGAPCSMMQRVLGQIDKAGLAEDSNLLIMTGEAQAGVIESQTNGFCDIVTEPERRDTMPSIMLACAYLKSVKGCADDEPVIVMPIDSYVEAGYFQKVHELARAAQEEVSDIVLMGVEPTYPSEKYGYIVPSDSSQESPFTVSTFVEKPSESDARKLIEQGALWNCGVFCFRLGYLTKIISQSTEYSSFEELRASYASLEKISFDYGVVEKAESVSVVPYDGDWKDLGTWNTLCEEMAEPIAGKVLLGEHCENVHVVNELKVPIVALGLKDVVIAATHDGILVSDKHASSYCKPYVEKAQSDRPMQENRKWGAYEVLGASEYASGSHCLVKHLLVKAGKGISYQRHFKRMEVWSIVEGEGELLLDGVLTRVHPGTIVDVPAGTLHGIRATSDLHIIEVQLGSELIEEDIERFEWPNETPNESMRS